MLLDRIPNKVQPGQWATSSKISLKTRSDGHLHLTDYKIELGEIGVERGNPLEAYYAVAKIWGEIMWDTPIHVDGQHQNYLFRYAGIVQMPSLTKHLVS